MAPRKRNGLPDNYWVIWGQLRGVTAALFGVAGLAGLVSMYVPGRDSSVNQSLALGLVASSLVLGVVIYLFPWERLSPASFVPFTLVALALMVAAIGVTGWIHSQLLGIVYSAVIFTAAFYPLRWSVTLGALLGIGLLAMPGVWQDPRYLRTAIVNAPLVPMVAYFTASLTRELVREQRERRYLSSLAEASRISTSLDLKQTLQSTSEVLLRVLDAHVCVIYLVDPASGHLVPHAVTTDPELTDDKEVAALWGIHPRLGEGLTGWVAETGEPILTGDAKRDSRARVIPGLPARNLSYILVPAKVEGRVTGVIRIAREGLNQFNPQDLELATIFANQAAIAIENARLYETTRELTITDGLTGLYNARHLGERLEEEISRARRYGHRLSLAMIDSDSLKEVNDRYGHQQGDRAVKELGQGIRDTVRQSDAVFRYAGDEFVVLMPETDASTAYMVMERVRRKIEERYLRIDGQDVRTTVSLGVATFPDHAGTAEDLIRRADEAMYRAKGAGKNRVMLCDHKGAPLASL
ncbi:MAG: sensor domain-containing diguanylate cyclase [Firmicutes bacterium]|nr:sensor domain-containing diguanylate cyclase [Bacillota bacterium]